MLITKPACADCGKPISDPRNQRCRSCAAHYKSMNGEYPADRGCSLHPHCLTCPFERCRYD